MAIPSASTSSIKAGGVAPQSQKSTAPSGLGGSIPTTSALNDQVSTKSPSKGMVDPNHAGNGGEVDPQTGAF